MNTGSLHVPVQIAHGEYALAPAPADDQRTLDHARHDDDAVGPLHQPGRDRLLAYVDEGLEHLARVGEPLVRFRVRVHLGGESQRRKTNQGDDSLHLPGTV